MNQYSLDVRSRVRTGTAASRRLRKDAGEVPGTIYGGNAGPRHIAIEHRVLAHELQKEAFYSQVIQLSVDGKTEEVVLKALQRHPVKKQILHADFMRIDRSQPIQVSVPLHFLNEESAVGVKQQGGTISHTMTAIEISCLPADLPEYIEVDMQDVEEGQILHISDLSLPDGVTSVALSHDSDLPVASIHIARAEPEPEEEEPTGEDGESTEDKAEDDSEGES